MKHIPCSGEDVARFMLLPGDPGRAKRIAERMDEAEFILQNREFTLYKGKTGGVEVGVCSTGIGGPSASIALEELASAGAEVFIRVGSAGGRQPDIPIGTPIILTAAFRGDGTSAAYLPREFPAVADFSVTKALVEAAERVKVPYRLGVGYTRDAYYRRDPRLDELLRDAGVVAAEQEAATLFVVGMCRGVKVGAIVATDSNIWLSPQPPAEARKRAFAEGEGHVIDIALLAARILAGREG
ncbi:nucleoside phosphorylase [Candidatus Bipolaricaulota bacterium]|nr:nucleoside phosphorylase [Candidatus Bipolaricaulota bacterium]